MIEPKIDDLLAAVDSKYSLVILSAKRAREINRTTTSSARAGASSCRPWWKPASRTSHSIALEEIAEGKIDYERPEEPEGE